MTNNKSFETIEDFLLDDSFVLFCLGRNEEATDYWAHWLEQHPEKKELAGLARQSLAAMMVEMEDVDENTAAFSRLLHQQDTPPLRVAASGAGRSKRLLQWSAAAAVILAVAIGGWYWQKGRAYEQIITRAGEIRSVTLPDGSVLVMNGGTTVQYPRTFDQRNIYLEGGEVFLQVKHDAGRAFEVTTASGLRIKDIGTAFSVKSIPSLKEEAVQVQEGIVDVLVKEQSAHRLRRNEALRINKATHQATTAMADSLSTSGWIHGEFALYDARFEELQAIVESAFGKQLQFEDKRLKDCRITILFRKEQGLDNILSILSSIYHFNIRQDGNNIIVAGSNCNG